MFFKGEKMSINEKIEKIEEITEEWQDPEVSWNKTTFEGYSITTSEQVIKILIDSSRSCCENYGYLCSEQDPTEFIGATLWEIRISDSTTKQYVIDTLESENVPIASAQFVDLHTDRGVLQFVVYNEHNGYYAHDIRVVSKQVKYEGRL
jgi:hypothetical protein